MENEIVEVRGSNGVAYEVRNGVRVEYAAGDRFARMRALGCPENIIARAREGKRAIRSAAPSVELLAAINGVSPDEFRRMRVAEIGRQILRQEDADRRARAARLGKQISDDAAEEERQRRFKHQILGTSEVNPRDFVDSLNRRK